MATSTSNGSASCSRRSFAFDAESEAEIAKIVAKYPPGRQASAVIPVLYIAQRQMKRQTGSAWIPAKAMDAVRPGLGMAPIRVYEVATFYFMFNTKPIGKFPSAGLHDDAVLAARLGRGHRGVPQGDRHQGLGRDQRGRACSP